MDNTMPILLVPGLVSSPRIFAPVVPALWRFGPVTVANHIRDDHMGAIARRILAEAPPRFALAGVPEDQRFTSANLTRAGGFAGVDGTFRLRSDGTTDRRSQPAVVVGLVGVRQIALAGDSSCAVLEGGFVRCWGPNDHDQLGDGSSADHTVPMPIKFR